MIPAGDPGGRGTPSTDPTWRARPGPSDHLVEFPKLAALIKTHYALSVDLEDFLVYRRRD
jgi:hypothetical protein